MAQQRMNVQAPIDRLFAKRWSTRAFASERPVTAEELAACLEAARWAPSCFGEEPWRFVVVDRVEHEVQWQLLLECLAPKNQLWARHAPVLIVAAAEPLFSHNSENNRWAEYDTGQAMICMSLQAEELGLVTHQMGGFNAETLKSALGMPEHLHVMSVTALGHQADVESALEEFQAMEQAPRIRRPLEESVHAGHWGAAWSAPAASGWDARYQETPVEKLPWFHAGLDGDIAAALDNLESAGTAFKGKQAVDLGCGPGTQAVALAKLGFTVIATEVSHHALESAIDLAVSEEVNITFQVDDVLESKISGSFDLVVDRGLFHCFADQVDQIRYLTTVRRLLRPGGVLLLKCFHKDESSEMGPPGRYDETDIRRLFADGFELLESHESHFDSTVMERSPKAIFCSLKKVI